MSAPLLSVVVPCFDEEESLPELVRRVLAVCSETVGQNFEFILIDDGSRDETRSLIRKFSDEHPSIIGVFLSRNFGHQLALTAGLKVCSGRRILILDADLQDPPELLPDMMRLMDDGADVVYGKRTERQGETHSKRFSAHLFYRFLNMLVDIDIPQDTGDFRLISRRALSVLNEMPEQHRFIRGMVSWVGFKQVPLEYTRVARFAGETKYPIRKMLSFAMDAIAGFSIVPLRLSIYLGFICALLGLFFFAYTAYSYLTGIAIQGWTTLMSVVLILGSGQLLVLGVIGEYLGRLYIQSKKRPLFIVEEIVRQGEVSTSDNDPDDLALPSGIASSQHAAQ
ncbi:glycosyltransferase family 2 protein [Ruegeria sp.]|uniref:glycosyltransferase family 2 protein n=1 Tax=Ruegeria sp. TaxID=1879320 RepID=UPI003C7C5AF0